MSGQFLYSQPPVGFKPVSVTGVHTDTAIVTPTDRTFIVTDFEVNSTDGTAANLTVEIWDGTTHFYLGDDGGTTWNAQAITTHKSYKFSGPYTIPVGSVLRFTNSAGNFVVLGNRLP